MIPPSPPEPAGSFIDPQNFTSTKDTWPAPISWTPINKINMHIKKKTTAPASPPRHHHEMTDSEHNEAVDLAIDVFEEAHGLAALLQKDFGALTRKVEGCMMIVDRDELCLADKEKRRRIIAQRLGLRRMDALYFKTSRPLTTRQKESPKNDSPPQSPHTSHAPKSPITNGHYKTQPKATPQISQILASMLAALENSDTTATALDSSTDDDGPEILLVEAPPSDPRSRFRIKIVRAPGRAGGYIIAPCDTRNGRLVMEKTTERKRDRRALEERRRELKRMIDEKLRT